MDATTLTALIEMEIESSRGDDHLSDDEREAAYELPQNVIDAAVKHRETVKAAALRFFEGREDLVEELIERDRSLDYLAFMSSEHHGVGIWDGDFDYLFTPTGVHPLKNGSHVFNGFIVKETAEEYAALKEALTDRAFEIIGANKDAEDED